MNWKDILTKKPVQFFLFCFWVVGTIGGAGVAFTSKYVFIGLCVLAVAAMAAPLAFRIFKGDKE